MLRRRLVVWCVLALLGLHCGLVKTSEGAGETLVGSGNATGSGDEVLTTHGTEEPHGEEDRCRTEEEMFSSEVHIAKVKTDGPLTTILAFAMFVMVVVVAKLSK